MRTHLRVHEAIRSAITVAADAAVLCRVLGYRATRP
jgi:hypothetical protein